VPGRQLCPALPALVFGGLTSVGRAAAARFNQLGRKPEPGTPGPGTSPPPS
jgi:hypothetical protein